VGADTLVLLTAIVENFQLAHPINGSDQTNNKENPVNGIGSPPAVHKAKKIQWCEKVVYK